MLDDSENNETTETTPLITTRKTEEKEKLTNMPQIPVITVSSVSSNSGIYTHVFFANRILFVCVRYNKYAIVGFLRDGESSFFPRSLT